MTLDDLVNVYFENNRTKNGTTRAGIRAVVEALRDELTEVASHIENIGGMDALDIAIEFNEILGGDGEGKAAKDGE